ncbi:glutathione S-transferase family protein [Pelagibius litoralis]|uniref:Glutathione S-transferase family protein n=1 Tax=Pelagibius litoralis TaxID=374515 RepID=A0A967C749_9PROT|nr:glutathione S-transferase family protein [Pelagibius litoralis]NIA67812.1 glutathione S-transferase family protein [Pelagibius litoralis]
MPAYKLILGNKTYSSWSLRGWLIVRLAGISFEEVVIFLRKADTKARILAYSPAGKVPTLIEDDRVIWDSLAIGEHLAERFPGQGLWPQDPLARSTARSVVAEMHAGFPALRSALPMDLNKRYPGHVLSPEVKADIARIEEIWENCRRQFGSSGDFLFGEAGIADAFFAPVVVRFRGYDVALGKTAEAYCASIADWPLMQQWVAEAAEEKEVIVFD